MGTGVSERCKQAEEIKEDGFRDWIDGERGPELAHSTSTFARMTGFEMRKIISSAIVSWKAFHTDTFSPSGNAVVYGKEP